MLKKHVDGLNMTSSRGVEDNKESISRLVLLGEKFFRFLKVKLADTTMQQYKIKLIQAGLDDKVSIEGFIGLKLLAMLVCFSFMMLIGIADLSLFIFGLALMAATLGYFYPEGVLKSRTQQRKGAIAREIPGLLYTLAIITDAGLNFNDALKKVIESRKGTLVKELSQVMDEVNMGILMKDALMRMTKRCDVTEIDSFAFTISQNLEKGTSGISEALRLLGKEAWDTRKGTARELGEQASMKLLFPMLLLVFPVLMVFLLGPALISIFSILSGVK